MESLLSSIRATGAEKQEIFAGAQEFSPGVSITNVETALNPMKLRELGITDVVNVGAKSAHRVKAPGLTSGHFLFVPLADNVEAASAVMDLFPPAIRFIEAALERGGSVLIHCDGGVSRSGSLAVAWLMTHPPPPSDGGEGGEPGATVWPYDTALEEVRRHRSVVAPNSGFARALSADGAAEMLKEKAKPKAKPAEGSPVAVHPDMFKNPDPDWAWRMLKDAVRVDPAEPVAPDAPRKPGYVRVVCVSDTHGMHAKMDPLPDGDILVHAGDFSMTGGTKDVLGDDGVVAWLERQAHTHKVLIAGNHDVTLQPDYYDRMWERYHKEKLDCEPFLRAVKESSVHYLEDEAITLMGLKIFGSPWSAWFHDWAFNIERGQASRDLYARVPADVEILVTHGPPLGHGDQCLPAKNRAGCVDLLHELETRLSPQLHVFGHIHEGYGVTTNGRTLFANASTCSFRYKPIQPALVFDIKIPTGDEAGTGAGTGAGAGAGASE